MKRFSRFAPAVPLLFALAAGVSGNGGPVDTSSIIKTGNLSLQRSGDISLESETLSVVIDGDYADVAVTYTFNNRGEPVTITYGFPVTWQWNPDFSEGWRPELVPSFAMKLGGRALDVTASGDEKPEKDGDEGPLVRWYTAPVNFPRGTSTLAVNYRVKNTLDDWETTKSFLTRYSPRVFIYDLQPSGNWGDGVVKSFRLTVDGRRAAAAGVVFQAMEFNGKKHGGPLFTAEEKNLDLGKAGTIRVIYDVEAMYRDTLVKAARVPKKSLVSIKASSHLVEKNYDHGPASTLDGDLRTAWVEGVEGDGAGQWIEIVLGEYSLSGVGIINGIAASRDLYYANGRAKKVRVDMEVKYPWAEKFETVSDEVALKDLAYPESAGAPRGHLLSMLREFGESPPLCRKIRITILEVYPGKKYRDTGIAEIVIFGGK